MARKRERLAVYLIASRPFVKVGIADNPMKRFRNYASSNPHHICLVAGYWLRPEAAKAAEAACHARLSTFHHRGEWYRASPAKALGVLASVCKRARPCDLGPHNGRLRRDDDLRKYRYTYHQEQREKRAKFLHGKAT